MRIWSYVYIILMVCIAVCLMSIPAKADQCQDPALKPELVKACYQMEKVCKEIGCTVKLR